MIKSIQVRTRELFKSIEIMESSAKSFSFRKLVDANLGLKVNEKV